MVMGYTVTSGSFVINHSQDERPLIKIALLGARMRGFGIVCIYELDHTNEEESGGNGSNEQDVCDEGPEIIWPWAEWI